MTAIATAGDALLADIIHDPHDDGLRLIYADWLEDHGQPERAEFIRVELDISRICQGNRNGRPEPDACRLDAVLRRQSELMHGVWELGWLDPMPREYISDSVHSRGFLDMARLPLAAWQRHGPALVRQHPLTRVELSDQEPNESHFAGSWAWSGPATPGVVTIGGSACLRPWLFDRLSRFTGMIGTAIVLYASAEEAVHDASEACLSWAWSVTP